MCKEDFYIYLEGHTDANQFGGRKYDKFLEIPEGTPYTRYIGEDSFAKETRNITFSLRS
ncbi:hypothetical protein OAK19_03375 [Aureispira]|nr:hypothetical protein [Aureispira sp.]